MLAAYVLLFPQRRVLVIMLRFMTRWVPALLAVGLWFVLQLVQSLGVLGENDGAAYAAHIGGFIAGLALIKVFALGREAG